MSQGRTARPSKIAPRAMDELPTGKRDAEVFRSKAWLDAVRSLDVCVLCGKHGVQAAHRNEGKAKGRKTDDCLTAAICPEEHAAIDSGKDMTRDERRATLDRAIVLTLQALVRQGKVKVVA